MGVSVPHLTVQITGGTVRCVPYLTVKFTQGTAGVSVPHLTSVSVYAQMCVNLHQNQVIYANDIYLGVTLTQKYL